MAREAFSDEDLMAYADGELDAESSRTLEAALDTDPDLARRLAVFTGTRDALAEVARARPPEPVSEAMLAKVRATLDAAGDAPGGNVIPMPAGDPEGRARSGAEIWRPAALAASLALVIGLGAGYFAASGGGRDGASMQVALLEAEGLERALSELLSGEARQLASGELRVIASFRDDEGSLCREFEFDATGGQTVVAVTCRDGAAWDTRLAIAANAADDSSYAPASSLDTLEAYLTAIGAGPALSAEDETSVLRPAGN